MRRRLARLARRAPRRRAAVWRNETRFATAGPARRLDARSMSAGGGRPEYRDEALARCCFMFYIRYQTRDDCPMPRPTRIEYHGAIYHVISRDDRREKIFSDGVDRQDFLKTLAESEHGHDN